MGPGGRGWKHGKVLSPGGPFVRTPNELEKMIDARICGVEPASQGPWRIQFPDTVQEKRSVWHWCGMLD